MNGRSDVIGSPLSNLLPYVSLAYVNQPKRTVPSEGCHMVEAC
jgi:hypothetical protein